jgi:predicted NACHT family NTPase
VRAVLLTGNGTLLINNTFVEWAAIQAIRRARPSAMLISFGVRNKLKPFSSMLVYSDQETASPIPDQMDSLGTYVDLEIFYQYIWQEFEKYAEYRNNTAYLFLADGLEELFCIAPPDFPLLHAKAPLKLPSIFAGAREWLND